MNKKVSIIIPVYNQEDLILKAIESIPIREDIEIIIINDCSTDNTLNAISNYKINHPKKYIEIYSNLENKGVGYTVNRGFDIAQGDWIVLLGSDDMFYTDELNDFIDSELDNNYDLIYFNLKDNFNAIWDSNENQIWPGSVKFMKRSFLGDMRNPEIRVAEDYGLHQQMMAKQPKIKFTHKVIKYYNWPRKGSLIWEANHKS